MQVPARFTDASGLQAFDLDSLLSMAQRSRKWQDPTTLANSTIEQLQARWPGTGGCSAAGTPGSPPAAMSSRSERSWPGLAWPGLPPLALAAPHLLASSPPCSCSRTSALPPAQVDTYMQRVLACLKAAPGVSDVEISAGVLRCAALRCAA